MFKIQNSVLFLFVSLYFIFSTYPISKTNNVKSNVIVGANQISKYENLLKNKRIGIVANHTSVIFKKNLEYTHLVDSLIKLDFDIRKEEIIKKIGYISKNHIFDYKKSTITLMIEMNTTLNFQFMF